MKFSQRKKRDVSETKRERKSVGGGGVWKRSGDEKWGRRVRRRWLRRAEEATARQLWGSEGEWVTAIPGGLWGKRDAIGCECVSRIEKERVRNVHSVPWLALSKDTHVQTLLHTHGYRQRHQKELRSNTHTNTSLSISLFLCLSHSIFGWKAQEGSAVIYLHIFSTSFHLFFVYSNFIHLSPAWASKVPFSLLLSQISKYFIEEIVLRTARCFQSTHWTKKTKNQ